MSPYGRWNWKGGLLLKKSSFFFPLSSFFRYIMMGDGQEVKNFLTCYDNTEKEV
jgi:hypothetical protein